MWPLPQKYDEAPKVKVSFDKLLFCKLKGIYTLLVERKNADIQVPFKVSNCLRKLFSVVVIKIYTFI